MAVSAFRWWHAVAVFVVANLASALPAGFNGDEAFYNSFARPRVAPPDWAFPPVWFALNVTSLVALHRVANRPASPGRRAFLIAEGVGWVLFAAFTAVYFGLRSPVLGAVDTVAGWVVAAVSVAVAARPDRLSAALVGLRLLWLTLASYVSVFVAVANPDPFFQRLFPS